MGSKRVAADLLGVGSNPYYASANSHQHKSVAKLLGVGSNPYYASANNHQSKPDSTALASQYSSPTRTNKNDNSESRSAADRILGYNTGARK